jgi:hypothetical protein
LLHIAYAVTFIEWPDPSGNGFKVAVTTVPMAVQVAPLGADDCNITNPRFAPLSVVITPPPPKRTFPDGHDAVAVTVVPAIGFAPLLAVPPTTS